MSLATHLHPTSYTLLKSGQQSYPYIRASSQSPQPAYIAVLQTYRWSKSRDITDGK